MVSARHQMKRRKLLHPKTPGHLTPTLSLPVNIGVHICTFCHRSFTGSRENQLVQCARCKEPTCTICSRTCNGCAPSVPPTPALTASPSSDPETPLRSPRLTASALSTDVSSAANTAQDRSLQPAVAGRRRKARDDAKGAWTEGEGYERFDDAADILPGCGRTVCQNCAFETPESGLTTCLDCAALFRGSG